MDIFSYDDYKIYVNDWIASQEKGGYGEYKRMAASLGVSSTMISQVFKGDKHLSLEMANEVCDFLNLNTQEVDFFFLLVAYPRAGTYKLKQRLHKRVLESRTQALDLKNRIKKTNILTEEMKSIFYSSWMYAGISNLAAIPEYNHASEISERLGIPKNLAAKVIEFLLEVNVCVLKNGNLDVGTARTHVPFDSPHVNKHHQNWRMMSLQKMQMKKEEDFFLTFPMSLSKETAQQIREELPAFIQKIDKWVGPSPSETVRCLNIDWFEY